MSTLLPEDMVTTSLSIGGMTCSNCVQSITSVLQELPGVNKIDISLMTETGVIKHKPEVTDEMIKEAVEDCGFEADIKSSFVQHINNNNNDNNDSGNNGGNSIDGVSGPIQITLQVFGMTCSNCSNSIESTLISLPGVKSCHVSLTTEELVILYDSDVIGVRDIVELIEDCGFDALVNSNLDMSLQLETLLKNKEVQYWKWCFIKCLLLGSPVVIFGHLVPSFMQKHHQMMSHSIGPSIIPGVYLDHICEFVLTSYLQFFIGRRFYSNAWKSLKHGSGTMDLLICISTSIAYFYSIFSMTYLLIKSSKEAPDVLFATTCMLFIFVSFGKWLENKAKGQTSTLLSKLISLTPPSCTLVENFNPNLKDLTTKTIAVELLQKNDVLMVTPGSKIPTDGVVIFGEGDVDESLLTGENMPVLKTMGSNLIGGSVNGSNVLYLKVTRVGDSTQLQQIVKLVKDAQLTKLPIQRYADSIASIFVPSIIFLLVTTFFMWYCVIWVYYVENWELPNFLQKEQFKTILQISISVVVVLCPCALGLAAPTLIMVGTGLGATNGVLIKSGEFLEVAKKINYILFDKTGTLTTGEFHVKKIDLLKQETNEEVPKKFSELELWNIIGNVERNSEHPIGRSLVRHSESYMTDEVMIKEIKMEPSMGVSSLILYRGELLQVKLGNTPMVLRSNSLKNQTQFETSLSAMQDSTTVTHILIDDEYLGSIELVDDIKQELQKTIEYLHNNGDYEIGMCTGDNYKSLMQVGQLLGLPLLNIYYERSPLDKSEIIKNLQNSGKLVSFVGDGTNDAPLLIQLDLGILISSGTDVAIESADVVLLDKCLINVIYTLDISIKTFNRIQLNFLWAMIYNAVMLPFLMGWFIIPFGIMLNPMFASLSMAFSSISVVLSSLLLKNWKLPVVWQSSDENAFDIEQQQQQQQLRKSVFAKFMDKIPVVGYVRRKIGERMMMRGSTGVDYVELREF